MERVARAEPRRYQPRRTVSLNWRYLPEVYTAGKAYENAVIANNLNVAAGGAGIDNLLDEDPP